MDNSPDTDSAQRWWRRLSAAAGFLVLMASVPCVLALVNSPYGALNDSTAKIGMGGLVLLALFVGLTLLYTGLKSPSQ